MIFHAPQLIWLALALIAFGVNVVQHRWLGLGVGIVIYPLGAALLWWGGFFAGCQ